MARPIAFERRNKPYTPIEVISVPSIAEYPEKIRRCLSPCQWSYPIFTSVFSSNFEEVLLVPSERITYLPAVSKCKTRLVMCQDGNACERYQQGDRCNCNFVHISVDERELRSFDNIHVNFHYGRDDPVRYDCFTGDTLWSISDPVSKSCERVVASKMLRTKAVLANGVQQCHHFHYHSFCHDGSNCPMVHLVSRNETQPTTEGKIMKLRVVESIRCSTVVKEESEDIWPREKEGVRGGSFW